MWSCKVCTFDNVDNNTAICSMCNKNGKGVVVNVNIKLAVCRQGSFASQDVLVNDVYKAEKEVESIRLQCQLSNQSYTDYEFTPSSLELEQWDLRDVEWRRPHSIIPFDTGLKGASWVLMHKHVDPHDIHQGILANCWFLSALAVTASRQDLLDKIFITKHYNKEGIYAVRLCLSGNWQTIIIDDWLPCNKQGFLKFSQAKRQQLWVPLLEKALAKVYKSYEALISGRCQEGLAILTGAPCESIDLQKSNLEKDLLWVQLLSSFESNYLMGISCGAGNLVLADHEYTEVGLQSKHAYSILQVRDIKGLYGQIRLLLLRNPWGNGTWTGAFALTNEESWNLVDRQTKLELFGTVESYGDNCGLFWILFDDLLKYFDGIDICRVNTRWQEMRLNSSLISSSENPKVVLLTVLEPTNLDLTLYQESQRGILRHNVCDLWICIHKGHISQSGRSFFVCNQRQLKYFVTMNLFLDPGDYTITFPSFYQWGSLESLPCTLAVHSQNHILLEEENAPKNWVRDVVIDVVISRGEKTAMRDGCFAYYLDRGWEGLIIVIENKTNMYLHVTCDFTDSQNVVCSRETLNTDDFVPPYSHQLLFVLTHLETFASFSVRHRMQHVLVRQTPMMLQDYHNPELKGPMDIHYPRHL